jgi:hypothetical protein
LIARIAATGLLAYATLGTSMAHADEFGAVNGVFNAVSNGDRARTNNVYMDEQTVVSTWTISTTCTMYQICEGIVSSDQGWTATISTTNGMWYVRREIPDWQHCAGGGTATGRQLFRFYPVNVANGQVELGSDVFAGIDRTATDGGSCGANAPTVIEMPFRLSRAS